MITTREDRMIIIENRLALCAHCDGMLPQDCTCPGVDEYREDVTYLLEVIRDLREDPPPSFGFRETDGSIHSDGR